jgi:two-component system sensor histidine kinase GlrK
MVQTLRSRLKSVYFYGPKSFLTLILIGFGFVALPLIFALIYSAFHVERLADKSQLTVYKAVQVTQNTRMLLEELTAMERSARQYHVLKDAAFLRSYEEKHQAFQQTLVALLDSLPDNDIRSHLRSLANRENDQYQIINPETPDSPEAEAALGEFISLVDLAQNISAETNKVIDREVDEMHQTSERTLQTLLWLSFAMIPTAIIFSALFTILLNRPIKQIDYAIRLLGDGEFKSPISVTGPHDLEYLGQRLNWLRRRLLDVENQKNKFIRHVSHELKTPLTALREGTELLADEVVGELQEEQREIVHILQQNGLRLQTLIEDLLNFNTAASHPPLSTVKPVRVDNIIQRVIKDHKLTLVAKNILLNTELAPCIVEGDDEKLRVIVDNLLSNAIKYSPSGGKISITLRENQSQTILDVYDSGPGIQPDEGNKIFETFYQGTPPAEGHIKGSGLGLSIAREHVLAHQGLIKPLFDSLGAHLQVILPQKQAIHVNTA